MKWFERLWSSADRQTPVDQGTKLINWHGHNQDRNLHRDALHRRKHQSTSKLWRRNFVSRFHENDATDDPNQDIMVVLNSKKKAANM